MYWWIPVVLYSAVIRLNTVICNDLLTRSEIIRVVWSESSLTSFWIAKEAKFLHTDNEDWSDYADAQVDLSLLWMHITKTYLYNFDPHKPHFDIVKLGFMGVYIIFLIFA